ncbi:MAG: hypothetical protein IIU73_00870, partial [Selenomonadales bacterium]|nr:hypothetical protein [Selenomonadales bacterium]
GNGNTGGGSIKFYLSFFHKHNYFTFNNILLPLTFYIDSPILTVEIEFVRAYVADLSEGVRYTAGAISIFARDNFV